MSITSTAIHPPPQSQPPYRQEVPLHAPLLFDIPAGANHDTMDGSVLTTLQFINLLKGAKLEDSGLSENDIYCLKNPRCRAFPNLDDDIGLKLSLELYYRLDGLP